MLKKNLFNKKFSKLLLSITKRIESFFNLFENWNSVKKIYLNLWKRPSDKKKIFIGFTSIFIAIIVYFLIPSFYDKDKVRVQLENQILKQYDFKIILDENFRYGLLPAPHFFSKNTNIKIDSQIIANSKNTKFFISYKNFLFFNKIKVKDLIFTNTDFKIDHSSLKFFTNLFNNKISDQNINFVKSKFFYLDQYDDVIFLADIKKMNYIYSEKFLNEIKSKFKIFNLPITLEAQHELLDKKIISKIDFDSLKLNINNHMYFDENELNGQLDFNILKKNKKIDYIFRDKELIFNSDDKKIIGAISIKPFFLSSNLNLRKIEVKKFLKNDSVITNLIKSEILNNKNLNGKISISADNLNDLKHVDAINFDIQFEEGLVLVNNLNFVFKNSVTVNLDEVNLIVEENKLKFFGDITLDFKDIEKFYSHFQVRTYYRKNIDKINSSFVFNLDDGTLEINELKISEINEEILKKYLNDFNSQKNNILNKVVFRNTIKDFFKQINLD